MFSHIFKIVWKKKASNTLLVLEILLSFFVLFAVFSLSNYFFQNYRNTAGLETDRVWALYLGYNTDTMPNYESIQQRLAGYKEVESFEFMSNNVPFSFSSMNNDLHYENRKSLAQRINTGPDFYKVFGMTLSEGRWYTWEDTVGGQYRPIVITRTMKEELFGTEENVIGKAWKSGEENPEGYRVVGVVDFFKYNHDFQPPDACFFTPQEKRYDRGALVLKMAPGADAQFEAKLARDLALLGKDWSVEVQHLEEMRDKQNKLVWIPLLIALVVCLFLVVNVALGLFGVLFQNIQRRKGEIGLRRAMGATKSEVLRHFVGETAMLAGLGIVLGLFFAVQFPLLHLFDVAASVYIGGMVAATAVLYALVLLCAWFPSRQAAQVFPADALREE